MFIENEISIFDFVCAISEAIDLVSVNLNNHHRKVAYVACQLAQKSVAKIYLRRFSHG